LSATAASASQINLAWSASTDNIGVTGYRVERCQGAGCTTFAQIAAPAGTTFSDTGLAASTSYSYQVRAVDAAGESERLLERLLGEHACSAPDTTAPTAPAALTATAVSTTQINLAWTASTDNVGVTGYQWTAARRGLHHLRADRNLERHKLQRHRARGRNHVSLPGARHRRGGQRQRQLEHRHRYDPGRPDTTPPTAPAD